MSGNLAVSFNSPQCGWMSIGFIAEGKEFHTTTAHAPHSNALSELLEVMVSLLERDSFSHTLKWNRNPEEFDFVFTREEEDVTLDIYEYPTEERETQQRESVFSHTGKVGNFCRAFAVTFRQLYEERDTDEFEQNWHQPFPITRYKHFESVLNP